MWNPLTLALALLAGVVGLACQSSTQATGVKGPKRLDRRLGYPGKRTTLRWPFEASVWAATPICAQTVPRPRFRAPSPVQTFAASELEPIPCNFSSARKVVAVKR